MPDTDGQSACRSRATDIEKLSAVYSGGSMLQCLGYLGLLVVSLRQLAAKDFRATGERETEQQTDAGTRSELILNTVWNVGRGADQSERVKAELEMCQWSIRTTFTLCGVTCPKSLTWRKFRGLRAGLMYFSNVPEPELTREILVIVAEAMRMSLPKGTLAWNLAKFSTARTLRSSGAVGATDAARSAVVESLGFCIRSSGMEETNSGTMSGPETVRKQQFEEGSIQRMPIDVLKETESAAKTVVGEKTETVAKKAAAKNTGKTKTVTKKAVAKKAAAKNMGKTKTVTKKAVVKKAVLTPIPRATASAKKVAGEKTETVAKTAAAKDTGKTKTVAKKTVGKKAVLTTASSSTSAVVAPPPPPTIKFKARKSSAKETTAKPKTAPAAVATSSVYFPEPQPLNRNAEPCLPRPDPAALRPLVAQIAFAAQTTSDSLPVQNNDEVEASPSPLKRRRLRAPAECDLAARCRKAVHACYMNWSAITDGETDEISLAEKLSNAAEALTLLLKGGSTG
jgi:hypothetical protein